MKLLFITLKKTLFWSYERGSWQYDIMCVLILAFIFFAPNSVFHSHRSASADAGLKRIFVVEGKDLGVADRSNIRSEIARHLSAQYGHEVELSRIEEVTDHDSGAIKYIAYEE